MDIQRARRAKANAKAKLEAKKRKLKRGNSDGDDQPLASAPAEPFKPQTSESSKHDWKWWGRQYMSLVYCAVSQRPIFLTFLILEISPFR